MKSLVRIGAACYAGALTYIFFLASRRPWPTFLKHRVVVNVMPLKHKLDELAIYGSLRPVDKWNFFTDLLGNILLFIPMPFFMVTLLKIEERWKTIFLAWLVSTCVEYTQFIFSVGVADTDDIILNTLGAALGVWMIQLYQKYAVRLNWPAAFQLS